jgi:hypothetical protein
MSKRKPRIQYVVRYSGFLGPIVRKFDTQERAEQWCRQVGRPDRIQHIERTSQDA